MLILGDVLNFSKIEDGKIGLRSASIELLQMCEESFSVFN